MELPRLCNFACDALAAAKAPLLGEDLIFGNFGLCDFFDGGFVRRGEPHEDPASTCGDDELIVPSV
jgi:hypothetical protein